MGDRLQMQNSEYTKNCWNTHFKMVILNELYLNFKKEIEFIFKKKSVLSFMIY